MNRLMISLVLCAAACGGKKDEPEPSTGSATGSAPTGSAAAGSAVAAVAAGSGSAAPVAVKDADLPTAEDFEEDSTKRITEKNVDTEVKALEKEIGEN